MNALPSIIPVTGDDLLSLSETPCDKVLGSTTESVYSSEVSEDEYESFLVEIFVQDQLEFERNRVLRRIARTLLAVSVLPIASELSMDLISKEFSVYSEPVILFSFLICFCSGLILSLTSDIRDLTYLVRSNDLDADSEKAFQEGMDFLFTFVKQRYPKDYEKLVKKMKKKHAFDKAIGNINLDFQKSFQKIRGFF